MRSRTEQDAEEHWDQFKPRVKQKLTLSGLKGELDEQVTEAKDVFSGLLGRFKRRGPSAR